MTLSGFERRLIRRDGLHIRVRPGEHPGRDRLEHLAGLAGRLFHLVRTAQQHPLDGTQTWKYRSTALSLLDSSFC